MKHHHNKRAILDIIKYPIVTDKTTKNIEDNIYYFAVKKKLVNSK